MCYHHLWTRSSSWCLPGKFIAISNTWKSSCLRKDIQSVILCPPSPMPPKSPICSRIKWYFVLPSTSDLRKQTIFVFHSVFTNLSSLINLMPQGLLMVFRYTFHFAVVSIVVSINSINLELFFRIFYGGRLVSRKKTNNKMMVESAKNVLGLVQCKEECAIEMLILDISG